MNVGKGIELAREITGLDRQQFAERLEVTVEDVTRWEESRGNPGMAIINRIVNTFMIPLDFIMLAAVERGDVPEEKQEFFDILVPTAMEFIKEFHITE